MRLVSAFALACTLLCGACSPTYDWREVRGADTGYTVLLPAKPSTLTRTIDLNGVQASMTMTAAEAGDAVFAVGAVTLADAAQAARAAQAMQTALVNNIGGQAAPGKPVTAGAAAGVEIDVRGTQRRNGQTVPVRMVARLFTHGRRAYQVLVLGNAKAVDSDTAEIFLQSFKPL